MRLKGKVAMVTGSSRGIGNAIAKKYLEEGAKVILIDRDEEGVKKSIEDMKQYGDAVGYAMDVTDRARIAEVFESVVKDHGTLDILVNNAGITQDAQMYKMTEDQWDSVINVNLKGVFNCAQEAVKIMREKKSGAIINISSVVGLYGNFGQVNYAATKSGVIGMTKSLAKEVGRKNVTVNAVAPGFIETAMTDTLPEKVKATYLETIPLNRFGNVDDVTEAVCFLASEKASYITGQIIHVNGGMVG